MPQVPSISQRARWAGGQPIGYLMQQALAHPDLISLAAGFVDQETLPLEATRQAFEALWSDPARARAALQYGSTPGLPALRERLLAKELAADGATPINGKPGVEHVVLTTGSNELLHELTDTLCDPGDIVLCTSPSYFVYTGILQNLGARAVGVACDDDGLIPEALEEQFERLDAAGDLPRVKAIYMVSYFDNPRGVTLALPRRAAMVELAKRWSRHNTIYVIDDMAYRELRYAGDDVPSLRSFDAEGDTVISAQTFSKSFAPGLRVGYGVLPPALVEPVLNQKGNIDFGSPSLNQQLVAALLELGLWRPHVEQLRDGYRKKLDAMLAAAEEFFGSMPGVRWLKPQGGLYVWMELPETIQTGPGGRLFEQAMREGMLYVPGEYCFPSDGPRPRNTMRLSFGVETCEGIRRGMAALARALRKVQE